MSQGKIDKVAAIEAALKHIAKTLGDDAIMRFGEKVNMAIDVVPSGSIALDLALGIGGYPCGRILEIFGAESSGKTTIALHAIAESQKRGGFCVFIDTEHAFDMSYASKIGVKFGKHEFVIAQPKNAEEALDMADAFVRSQVADVIVIDSVAALVPKAELEDDMGVSHMGLQARLMSQALRKLTGITANSKTIVIFINQVRQKIGVVFGNPEVTTGGNALKFYCSLRMEVKKRGTLKDGESPYGNQVTVKIVKNKVAPPFRIAELDIIYGKGICKTSELVSLGVKFDILQKSGSWYSIGGVKLGQGQDSVKKYLEQNPSVAIKIENDIKNKAMNSDIIDSVLTEHVETAVSNDIEIAELA